MTALQVATLALAAAGCAAWAHLVCFRGGFWIGRDDDRALAAPTEPSAWPRVTAVVPARDEAALVGSVVASLLAQEYPGELRVVVVDDHSTDGTAAVARRAARDAGAEARLAVVAAPPLAAGWTGKLAAMRAGVAHVEGADDPPEWLLFTDADIRYGRDAVRALVSSAVARGLVLSSRMVRLRCTSLAERAFVPAFVYFFQMLYPFAWVRSARRRTAAAAGGCMLVRRDALRAAGGLASIRGSLIDDCALARRLKPHGPIALALANATESLRPYPRVDDVRRMIVRSAYAQLRFSPLLLAAVALAMTVVFVAPVALALAGDGWTRAFALASWIAMAATFVPIARRYGVSPWWGVALPAIAATYLGWTVESALAHRRGRGGLWKGRVHEAAGR